LAGEELIFGYVDGMCLKFNHTTPCKHKDVFQAVRRSNGRKIEEVVRQLVPASENAIHGAAIPAVQLPLFATPKREIASNARSFRQKIAEQNVGGQVHVMMTI